MANNIANYAELKILAHSVGKTSWTMPTSVLLALYTVTPSDTGGGTEVTGGNYARQETNASWATAASGAIATNADITFPVATGWTGLPVTVVAISLLDQSDNFIWWGPLTSPKTIGSGDVFKITAGNLTLSLD